MLGAKYLIPAVKGNRSSPTHHGLAEQNSVLLDLGGLHAEASGSNGGQLLRQVLEFQEQSN